MTQHTEVKIPPPQTKPVVLVPSVQASGTMYGNPLGSYEIAYTLVDAWGRHSEMSPAVAKTFREHWLAIVRVPTEQLRNLYWEPVAAFCVWWRKKGETRWYPMGGQQFATSPAEVIIPYLPLTGWTQHRYRGHMLFLASGWSDYGSNDVQKGSKLPAPAFPLSIRVMNPPKQRLFARWRWVTDSGVTDPSPVVEIPPTAQDERYEIKIACNENPRNGCHGRVLELSEELNKGWHVQPTNDKHDYGAVWPLSSNIFSIHHFDELSPSGLMTVNDKSKLHPVQQAMERGENVSIDGSIELYSPLVNKYNPASFYRTISGVNGSQWQLVAKHFGPAFLECNQRTRLVGMTVKSSMATAGIDFCDPTGGGAFHFRAERCRIDLYDSGSGTYQDAYGVGCLEDSRDAIHGGHSCSEPVFDDCEITARYPVVIEGQQSANWLFRCLNIWGGYLGDNAAIIQNNANDVSVLDRFTVDGVRSLLSVGSGRRANIENIFTDKGIPIWFQIHNRQTPFIRAEFNSGQNQYGKEQLVTIESSKFLQKTTVAMVNQEQANSLPKVYF